MTKMFITFKQQEQHGFVGKFRLNTLHKLNFFWCKKHVLTKQSYFSNETLNILIVWMSNGILNILIVWMSSFMCSLTVLSVFSVQYILLQICVIFIICEFIIK